MVVQQLGGPYDGFRWLVTMLGLATAALAALVAPVFAASAARRAAPRQLSPLLDSADGSGAVPGGGSSRSIADPLLPAGTTSSTASN